MDDHHRETSATLVAYGYFIAETPGARDYDEAVKLRGMTYEQAAAEIRAKVARAMRWEERRAD